MPDEGKVLRWSHCNGDGEPSQLSSDGDSSESASQPSGVINIQPNGIVSSDGAHAKPVQPEGGGKSDGAKQGHSNDGSDGSDGALSEPSEPSSRGESDGTKSSLPTGSGDG